MTPAQAIAALNRSLERGGATVALSRQQPTASVTGVRAKVRGLGAQELRPGTATGQGNFRAILTPADLGVFPLPVRTTDKILYNGQQRTITYVAPIQMGGVLVRLEIDFIG